jgi:chromosome segregation ATPase
MDSSSSSFSSASSGGGTDGERQVVDLATASLTNELLLLKNKKRAVETELEELARKPPEGKNKKQLRELKEELEEKLQKIKKKIKKLKQELEELGVGGDR